MNNSQSLLNYGVNLLKSRNIDYWLDCGTLLGIVRDGKLIPWDYDIDVSVLSEQINESDIQYIFDKAKSDGYDVNVYKYSISIYRNDYVFDVKILKRKNNYLFERKRIPKNLLCSAVCFTVHCFSSKYGCSRKGLNRFRGFVIKFIQGISKIIPYQLRSILMRPFVYLCNKYLTIDISEAVPYHLLETFDEIEFKGKYYRVPFNKEEYLTFRYGELWTEPNGDWVTERDDGAYLFYKLNNS